MTITWGERPKRVSSTNWNKPEADREYWVSGTLDQRDAILTIANVSPGINDEDCLDSSGNPVRVFRSKISAKEEGGGVWTVPIHYEGSPDQFNLKFNIGVQTTKMRQCKEHIRTYDTTSGASLAGDGDFTNGIPDFKGAIMLSGDGANRTVEGADVEIDAVDFTITKRFKLTTMSSSFLQTIADMMPSVNDRVFAFVWKTQVYAFPKGSVRFRGFPTDQSGDDDIEMVYYFVYSKPDVATTIPAWNASPTYPTGTQVSLNGVIWQAVRNVAANVTPIEGADWHEVGPTDELHVGAAAIVKEGWELAWPWYRPSVANGSVIAIPQAVVIDRVYNYGNFDNLNL